MLHIAANPEENMNSTFRRHIIIVSVVCLTLISGVSYAQNPNATVTGRVTDPTGSVVSSASVVLTSLDTHVPYKTETNQEGLYRLTGLLPGTYRADVTMDGFKTLIKQDIRLHVQDDISLNFPLQVGSISQSVTVQSGEPLLQTETSSLSQVVEGRTLQETPLNGRNVINLVELVPGVVPQGASGGNPLGNQLGGSFTSANGWGNYQIGGGMANQSAMYIDGAPINVSFVNSVSLVPTQDAIQEFRVATSNVSPEFGRFAGGVVNMATKSGTSVFHGSGYEYLRNTVLNANNFFNNRQGLAVPVFLQNQYGANIGGPIKKDKTFFFFAWEGFSLRQGNPTVTTVPTKAMRTGDFSATGVNIYDPLTSTQVSPGVYDRQQFQCDGVLNVICPDRIDPTAKVIQNFFPLPNLPGDSNNFAVNASVGGNHNQYNARVDHTISEKQRLFTRYIYWRGSSLKADPFNNSTALPASTFRTHQVVIGDTYVFSPTTIADFRVSYLRFANNTLPLSNGVDLSTFGPGYASLNDQVSFRQNPVPSIAGVTSSSWSLQDLTVLNINNNYTVSGSLTKMLGRHALKFGSEARKIQWAYDQVTNAGGGFNFDNGFTARNPLDPTGSGLPLASFLLGYASGGSLNTLAKTDAQQWYGGVYLADTFQVSSKLTLNLGLRWEQPGAFAEDRDRLTVWQPDAPDPLAAAVGLPLHGQVALTNSPQYPSRYEQKLHWNLFSPRLGFAYRLPANTVVRGGYGLTYIPSDVTLLLSPAFSAVNSAATYMTTSLDGGITPFNTLSNPFPDGIHQPAGHDQAALATLEGGNPFAPQADQPYPYVQQWNFNIEHELGTGAMFEIAYAGSKGTHLPSFIRNPNQIPDKYLSMGADLLTPVNNPFYGVLPASAGFLAAAPTIPQGYLLVPYPQFLGVTQLGPTTGASVYHSLQAKFVKRMGSGGNLLASYTWSKLISDTDTLTYWLESSSPGGNQDNYNVPADRSLSSNDVPQRLILSYTVDLPFGIGKRFGDAARGVTSKVISGWGFSGISTFQSGFPLVLTAQGNTLYYNFGGNTIRPNVVPDCQKSISGSAQSRLDGWFNTSCFTQPGDFAFGNESRNDSTLRAAGIHNWDMALFKNTTVSERVSVQFRAEVFNLFNRVQFGPPGTSLGTPQFGVVSGQVNQPRLLQFGLRLSF
jgi:hypothetical protein